ncbi:TetR/AcrR family transcriptional regulator [Actinocorallia populi]|uniref:TetR/AcrR family transcriptional regulator n=1 Tax=Actinocorallia populi TaxID=2079200 RepID=UPI000D09300C|nr:TetR/AcrR family transcriptional regulator [Actinocorallia populi]
MGEEITEERIVGLATRLFAGLGYDLTSLETIADAAGASVREIVGLTGGKRELYLRVMDRVTAAKYARIEETVGRAGDGRAAAHVFADAFLDFYVEHPEFMALWIHRQVSDAAEIDEIEDRYARPVLRLVARKIGHEAPEGFGAYPLMGVVIWSAIGFLGSGILAPGHGMLYADDPAAVEIFRSLLHTTVDRILGPGAAPPPGGAQPR